MIKNSRMDQRILCFASQILTLPPGIISVTGAGGKTSLLFSLGKALATDGASVICTTTTKMASPHATTAPAFSPCPSINDISLSTQGCVLVAKNPLPSQNKDKIYGYLPTEIDSLFLRKAATYILVEADGAAKKTIKAPATHEPVIPSLTKVVIGVIGLSCLDKPLNADTALRPELLSAITKVPLDEPIRQEAIAALVLHPYGLFKNCPESALRILFCNQSDTPEKVATAQSIADLIHHSAPKFLHNAYSGALQSKGLQCVQLIPA